MIKKIDPKTCICFSDINVENKTAKFCKKTISI